MTEDTQRQSGPAAPQPKPRLDLVVLDCPDALELARP
jgi:hypothetical protein